MHDYLLNVHAKPKVCPDCNLRLIELMKAMAERVKASPDKNPFSR